MKPGPLKRRGKKRFPSEKRCYGRCAIADLRTIWRRAVTMDLRRDKGGFAGSAFPARRAVGEKDCLHELLRALVPNGGVPYQEEGGLLGSDLPHRRLLILPAPRGFAEWFAVDRS